MRVVIQRVLKASVTIDGKIMSAIQKGLLVLAGFEAEDEFDDLDWISRKITQLRIFDDPNGVMNLSVKEIQGEILVVSQFTLYAKTKKGNRPSYIGAAPPEISVPLYQQFISIIGEALGQQIKTGEFGAAMEVFLINDGPVTIVIDSKNKA